MNESAGQPASPAYVNAEYKYLVFDVRDFESFTFWNLLDQV